MHYRTAILLFLALAVTGCDPFFAQRQPAKSDLVGVYHLSSRSIAYLQTKGISEGAKTEIELLDDGSFRLRAIPSGWRDWADPLSAPRPPLQDFQGTWELRHAGDRWELGLSIVEAAGKFGYPGPQILDQKSPYRLMFMLKGPDSSDVLIFEK